MSRFLYFQDGHISGKNSVNRKGNYLQDWLIKFDELINIALENEVTAILDGGDLFHSPIVSYSVCDEIVDRIEKSGLTYYCLFGNHAERYHSIEHSYDTTLAHILRRSKNFQYMPHLKCGNQYEILPIEYSHNIEEEIKEKGIYFKDTKRWKIAIVHAFITTKSFPFATHVVCDDIKTIADLVLVAHYHSVWEKKVGNTQYLDIGCFGRNSVTEADIEPSCVLLDIEKRSYKIIKIKSAKKGSEIFDLEKINDIKANDVSLEQFIKSLESTEYQGQNIKNIIIHLAKEKNIKKEIVDLVLNKIGENSG